MDFEVVKFDPDQPRDEDGRWTSIGGTRFEGARSLDDEKGVVEAIGKLGKMGDYLKKHPLGSIRLGGMRSIPKGHPLPEGVYVPGKGKQMARIELKAAVSYQKETFTPGKSENIMSGARSQQEARNLAIAHELGHHLARDSARNPFLDKALDAYIDGRSFFKLTRYGKTDPGEAFAEGFAAYFHRPREYKQFDPAGYALMGRTLKGMKIL